MKTLTTQAILTPKIRLADCPCKTCGYSHPSLIEMDYHYLFHKECECPKDIREWRDSSTWHPKLSSVIADILHDNACIYFSNELNRIEREENKELELHLAEVKLTQNLHKAGRI